MPHHVDSSSSWFEIADGQSSKSVFVNLLTGECNIDLPPGAQLQPRDPEGEWWELFDDRHGLPYYYHASTAKTVWHKPDYATIIPLSLLQRTVLGQRVSVALSNRASFYLIEEASQSVESQHSGQVQDLYRRVDSAVDEQRTATTQSSPASPPSSPTVAPIPTSDTSPSSVVDEPVEYGISVRPVAEAPLKSADPLPQGDNTQYDIILRSTFSGLDNSVESFSAAVDPSASAPAPAPRPIAQSMTTPPRIKPTRSLTTPASAPSARPLPTPPSASETPKANPLRAQKSLDSLTLSRTAGQRPPTSSDASRPFPQKRKSFLTLCNIELRPDSVVSISTMASEVTNNDATSPGWEQSAASLNPRRTSYFLTSQGRITRSMSQIIQSTPSLLVSIPPIVGKQTSSSPTIYRHTVPDELKSDTSRFRIDSFARTYFATHKRGLFRRKVPLKDMLRFSPNSLHKPLIRLAKDYRRDALKCFKVIQRVMGDRNRSATAADDTDIQWLLDRAIGTAPLRDEIYVQLCKQLTGNPRPESIFRGWLLACVVVQFFPPTTHFEDYLKSFIQLHFDSELQRIDVLSRFTFMKLQKSIRQGPMSKTPSIREISHAKQAPFCPSIFGESLDFIMQNAEAVDTELGIPRILTFLTDIILQLNGPKSEGIFRIPGDVDQVNRLRHRLDTGDYTPPAEISDPNIPASLFKLWLRDLHDPLIPGQFYHHCVNSPQDPDEILKIMTNIKGIRLRVADYVIQFLQVFAQPENSRLSKMNISNLAVVFAPIFLRCPSNNLKQAVVNSQSEQLFVKNLLRAWKGIEIEANNKI